MKKLIAVTLLSSLLMLSGASWAWSNHTIPSYRALEILPALSSGQTVVVERLEDFLRAEEAGIEQLLEAQEAWAQSKLREYAPRPSALAFKADPTRSDVRRRLAFLRALRVAPNTKFTLYYHPDPRQPVVGVSLSHDAISTLPDADATRRFLKLSPGEQVPAIAVVASACDEPDYGLDINLWSDSPSDWGKDYGFGKLPFGNPALPYSTQAPFHMAFMHESTLLYKAAPFLQQSYPILRIHQFGTLSSLAFRTGHDYWGWRFAGLALHYLQDLTQPYHASLAPGESTIKLLLLNALASIGFSGPKDDMVVLLSNRHLALEKYQSERLHANAVAHQDGPLERALASGESDRDYPAWGDDYVAQVVAAESSAMGEPLVDAILTSFPSQFVSDPRFEFGVEESHIDLMKAMADTNRRAQLEQALGELMTHFGSHSRNALLGIKAAGTLPNR